MSRLRARVTARQAVYDCDADDARAGNRRHDRRVLDDLRRALRPLPYPDSGQLVRVHEFHQGAPLPPGDAPLANTTMYAWRRSLKSSRTSPRTTAANTPSCSDGDAVRIHGAEASSSFFPLLRARPSSVAFSPPPKTLPTRTASSSSVTGCGDGVSMRGAMPSDGCSSSKASLHDRRRRLAGLAFPDREVEIWTPYEDPTLTNPTVQGGMWLAPTLGRLKPGVTLAAAEAEGTAAARAIPRPCSRQPAVRRRRSRPGSC